MRALPGVISFIKQKEDQIVNGLNKTIASTGTPMENCLVGRKEWLNCQILVVVQKRLVEAA